MAEPSPESAPRLIFVTQLIDPDDPVLGFVVGLVSALAERCDRLWVIANEVRVVPEDLGADVISLGKEDGRGKVARGLRFESSLLHLVRSEDVDTMFVHMCPVYLNLAAPLTKTHGVRTLLWFAHPANGLTLRIADSLTDGVVSSLPGAYPRGNGKVRYIGQAIDVSRFPVRPITGSDTFRLLMLNRLSPVKGIPTVLRAVARAKDAGVATHLSIVGPTSTPAEEQHGTELLALVEELGIRDEVTFEAGVPPARVPEVIAESHAVINATSRGSGDKTILESMAAGRPVILSNEVFAPLVADLPVELFFDEGDETQLAARITALAQSDVAALNEAGEELRRRVSASHSLDRWADRVVAMSKGGAS
jgi:glycosyltransferase involved in cell wall biosynthesis